LADLERNDLPMRVQNDVRVTVRVDKALKDSADYLFERLGMNMTTAFNIFLRKAVDENAIPFAVSVNSGGFAAGRSADDITRAFTETMAREAAHNLSQDSPVARYDAAKGQAHLERGDGTREYVENGR
jgi:DNA-damage-inducible protein J